MPKPDPAFLTKAARKRTFYNTVSCGSGTNERRFSWLSKHSETTALTLVECGFYYSPTPRRADRVLCCGCGYTETIHPKANVQLILRTHFTNHNQCLLSVASAHTSITGDLDSAENINQYWESTYTDALPDPLSPAAVLIRRKTFGDSFIHDKKHNFRPKPINLAEAGFIYSPDDLGDDSVICIYCGCMILGWLGLDSPMAEHQSHAKMSCFFLNQYKNSLPLQNRATTVSRPLEDEKSANGKKPNTYLGIISDLESDENLSEKSERRSFSNPIDSAQSSFNSVPKERVKKDYNVTLNGILENDRTGESLDLSDELVSYPIKRRRVARSIVRSPVSSTDRDNEIRQLAGNGGLGEGLNGGFWDESPEKSTRASVDPLPNIRVDSDSDNALQGIDSTDTSLQMIAHANNTYSKKHRARATPVIHREESSSSDSDSDLELSHLQSTSEAKASESLFVDSSLENDNHTHTRPDSSGAHDASSETAADISDRITQKVLGGTSRKEEERIPTAYSVREEEEAPSDPPYTPSTTASEKERRGKEDSQGSTAFSNSQDLERSKKRLRIKRDIPRKAKRRNLSSDQELNPYDAQNVSSLERQIDKTGLVVDLSPATLHLPAAKIVAAQETRKSSNLVPVVKITSLSSVTKNATERAKTSPAKSSLNVSSRVPLVTKGLKRRNIFDMSMDLDFFTPKTGTSKSRSESPSQTATSRPSSLKNSRTKTILEPNSEVIRKSFEADFNTVLDQNVLDASDHELSMQNEILAESTFNGASELAAAQSNVIPTDSKSTAPVADVSLQDNGNGSSNTILNITESTTARSQFDDSNDSILGIKKKSEQVKLDKDTDESDTLYADYVNDLKSIQDISLQIYSSDANEDNAEREQEDDENEAKEKGEVNAKEVLSEKEGEESERRALRLVEKKLLDVTQKMLSTPANPASVHDISIESADEKDDPHAYDQQKRRPSTLTHERELPRSTDKRQLSGDAGSRESNKNDAALLELNDNRPNALRDRYDSDSGSIAGNETEISMNNGSESCVEDHISNCNQHPTAHEGEENIPPSSVDAKASKSTPIRDTSSARVVQLAVESSGLAKEQAVSPINFVREDLRRLSSSKSLGHGPQAERLTTSADALTSESRMESLEIQSARIYNKMANSKTETISDTRQDEYSLLADGTVIHHHKHASIGVRQHEEQGSSKGEETQDMNSLHKTRASGLVGLKAEIPHFTNGGERTLTANVPKHEHIKAERLSLPTDPLVSVNKPEWRGHSNADGLTNSHTDLAQSSAKKIDTSQYPGRLRDEVLPQALNQTRHSDNEFARSKPSYESIPAQPLVNRHASYGTPVKAGSGRKVSGDLSEAIEASTPQSKDGGDGQKGQWLALSTDSLAEMLDHMADASRMLKTMKEIPRDLHDDLGELTNFIAEMPEPEENMTVEEWIEHTAENAREMIRDFTAQAIEICISEYDRAISFVEAMETSD